MKTIHAPHTFITLVFFGYSILVIWQPQTNMAVILVSGLMPIAAVSMLWMVGLLLGKRRYLAGVHAFSMLLFLLVLLSAVQLDFSCVGNTHRSFSVLHANVLLRNSLNDFPEDKIVEADADVLIMHEYGRKWAERTAVSAGYPYSVEFPDWRCCYGAAIFSKLPITDSQVLWYTELDIPMITCIIQIGDQSFRIASFHARSPGVQSRLESRNEHLALAGEMLGEMKDMPLIVTGDFNAVPWDSNSRNFMRETKLRHCGTGLWPSFPTGLPFLPIDYSLSNDMVCCHEQRRIGMPGSDHLALLTTYSLKE